MEKEKLDYSKHVGFPQANLGENLGLNCSNETGKQVCQVSNPKIKPKLIAYGTLNVYEINGKAYYQDVTKKDSFVRAPERDSLIKKDCLCKFNKPK